MTLVEFLLARLSEDEAAAKNATWSRWSAEGVWQPDGAQHWAVGVPDQDDDAGRPMILFSDGLPNGQADIQFVSRFDPARVLAECDNKRRIIAMHKARGVQGVEVWTCRRCDHAPVPWDNYITWPCPTLRLLALPYSSHPDYRKEWDA